MVSSNRNILGSGIARQIYDQSSRINRIFRQQASGRRIAAFSEDASGGAIAARLEAAFRGLGAQIEQNQTQLNRLQTEESGFAAITDELQQIRDLQIQARNGALSQADVDAIQGEINQRVENIRGVVQNTQFAGTPLIQPGSQLASILENGVRALDDLTRVDDARNEVLAERGEIGAEMNAVRSRIAEWEVALENVVAGFSRLSDLDMATGVTEQVNAQMMQLLSINSLSNLFIFNRQNALMLLSGL